MKILFLDFETTGVDVFKDKITEYAYVLWDTDRKQPLLIRNNLVRGPYIHDEVKEITGIDTEMLCDFGEGPEKAMYDFLDLFQKSDCVCAHNGTEFDQIMLEQLFVESGATDALATSREKIWIDTRYDLPLPKKIKTRNLVHLAAEHGFVNPFAHRALSDVFTMIKIFSCYSLDAILELAASPMKKIRADVSYERRGEASKRGYSWDAEKKIWFKNIKECHLDAEKKECPFPVLILK